MVYEQPTSYEFFYQGNYSPLDPNYGSLFLGYRIPFSQLQLHTNPQTANIIAEASDRLSQGVRGVMVNVLEPMVFENIPKQLFEEVRRLHKLVGAEPSMHAPIIDPSGFTREGWSEKSREEAELQLKSIIEKAHILDPEGNIPVTIHASMLPSTEWWKKVPGEKEEIYVVNTETRQLLSLPYEERYYPGPEKQEGLKEKFISPGIRKEVFFPEEQIKKLNAMQWHNRLLELSRNFIEAEKILLDAVPAAVPILAEMKELEEKVKRGELSREKAREELEKIMTPEQRKALAEIEMIKPIYEEIGMKLKTAFDEFYRECSERMSKVEEKEKKIYETAVENLKEIGKKIYEAERSEDPVLMHTAFSEAMQKLDSVAKIVGPPRIYKPVEEFLLPHTSKTIGNVAFEAFKKYREKAPVIALENVYPFMAFSRADSLKKLIEESRKVFLEKAIKEGYDYEEAKKAAEKLIGATWDVGHIYLLKKEGYKEEEIIKETAKIAPFVKFVHLTDNFGYEDSHLAPGMGEIPFKEILKELEKAGKVRVKHAIEAGGLLNLGAPGGRLIFPTTLEAFGVPIYTYEPRAPFWNQLQYLQAAYSMGYGPISTSLGIYEFVGFANLPAELGGRIPGRKEGFAGTPME